MKLTRTQMLIYFSSIILLFGMFIHLWSTIKTIIGGTSELKIHAFISIIEGFLIVALLIPMFFTLLFIARHYAGHRQIDLIGIFSVEMTKVLKLVQIILFLLVAPSLAYIFIEILEGRLLQSPIIINRIVLVIIIILSVCVLKFVRSRLS